MMREAGIYSLTAHAQMIVIIIADRQEAMRHSRRKGGFAVRQFAGSELERVKHGPKGRPRGGCA